MEVLKYPFDSELILKKKKSLKKELLDKKQNNIKKKIAILGGSTTSNIKLILELFLLNYGIEPDFYESEYNQYWQDAMFDNEELKNFNPDIIFIHTTNRNIINYPKVIDDEETVKNKLEEEYLKYESMWQELEKKYHCPIIQNNFEYPFYRLLGNKDATSINGKTNFITKLNMKFAEYAEKHNNFYINDINYQSSQFGLEKWNDLFYWYMYKYTLSMEAIPTLAFNVANIIKAIYGKNKKGLVLDLDNTLWGGIVGDDGVENIQIGQETATAEAYLEFQEYLKEHKDLGILLNVNSKNEMNNAIAGLNHEDGVLKPDDFIVIKANWNPKSQNMIEIAEELNLGVDSLVFVDDNPAERAIVKQFVDQVETPAMETVDKYIKTIDRNGYFEVINISKDDLKKSQMYKENVERNKLMNKFEDYGDYLKSLEMKATIQDFIPMYMARIAQLTNKSNQFNLTTKRYNQSEIEEVANSDKHIALYGKLSDIFGDNGVVSVIIGEIKKKELHLDLWIMSCRVLKRDMEFAMMDKLVEKAKEHSINKIIGYYYPTAKNSMVKDFYKTQGFKKIKEDETGNTVWEFRINKNYELKNKYINMEE